MIPEIKLTLQYLPHFINKKQLFSNGTERNNYIYSVTIFTEDTHSFFFCERKNFNKNIKCEADLL